MLSPERAGRYLVFHEIAAGGMGAVHLGRLTGPGGFSRTVAIKRPHPHLAREQEFVTMLLDEARIASRIHHPNVVQTLDVVADGQVMLVLEYVHGESLDKLVKKSRERGAGLEPTIAVAIVADVLHGLHAAHETNDDAGRNLQIVHRDVSPQNVLVGSDGAARIIDFGIAQAVGRLRTTQDGRLKGKLAYMAPEQLSAKQVDRRTDVYAASVVLWELLAGRRLYEGPENVILRSVLASERPPLPGLQPALEALLEKGLAREPDQRWATAAQMAAALEATGLAATRSAVAEWVAREWPEAEARRRSVSQLELDVTERHGELADATGSAVAFARPPAPAIDPAAPTRRIDVPRHRRRWPLALALGSVAAVAIAAAAASFVTGGAAPPLQPPPAMLAAPQPEAAAAEPPQPTPDVAPEASRSAPARRKPARSVRGKTSGACDPPYVLDAQGNHIWKRECM